MAGMPLPEGDELWTKPLEDWSLHDAAYAGQFELARKLIESGADVNARAARPHRWISSAPAGDPTPLHCVCIAWSMTEGHLQIARLLLEKGARVDKTHRQDFAVEMTTTNQWEEEVWSLLSGKLK
jgi:hypothetical protein